MEANKSKGQNRNKQNSHCKLPILTSNAYQVYFIIIIFQNDASYLYLFIEDLLLMSKMNAQWFMTFRFKLLLWTQWFMTFRLKFLLWTQWFMSFRLKFLLWTQWFMSFRLNSSFQISYRRHHELVCRCFYLVSDAVSVYNHVISFLLFHLQSRYLLNTE